MSPIAITLTLLVCVIILFVTEKLPLAVTSMLALMVLVLTGVLSPKDAFAGFVDNNLILFVAMFVIGGAFGYTDALRKRADFALSFSKMTFTHQMIRLLLIEQIYRAFKISRGEKYHN